MRALLLMSFVALALCAGCVAPSDFAHSGICASETQQASLKPVACAPTGWRSHGTVYTHPNGDGPQVEIWGPPSWSGGGAGG